MELSKTIMEIAEKLRELNKNNPSKSNCGIYLVGGAVRDMALGKEPHDMDFCVTGITAEEFCELFGATRVQGKAFPVFIVDGCEVALARTEKKTGQKHTDFQIETNPGITIEQDLARRDLTINSMAVNLLDKKVIDPFNGMQDIKNKVLRATTDAFKEDALRVYRTARFAAQLGFDVDSETIKIMTSMKDELSALSAERVFVEFRKALNTEKPSVFFEVLRKANVLDVHFNEVASLIGVEQPAEYHPEGDAYIHTLIVLDEAKGDELTKFGALVHDFGKAVTPKELWPHHYGHEEAGVPLIKAFCKRLKMPINFEKVGIVVAKEHMKAGKYKTLKDGTKVTMFSRVKASGLSFKGFETIARSDSGDETINFAEIAKQVMAVGLPEKAKEELSNIDNTENKEKWYGKDGKIKKDKIRSILMQERINKLKELEQKGLHNVD